MFSFLTHRATSPILIGIAIFFGIFILKPLYQNYIEKETILFALERDFTQKEKEYNDIVKIKEK